MGRRAPRGKRAAAARAPDPAGAPAPLAGAEEMYRALFEYAPIGFGVADLEGNLLAFNDAILAPGGYTREDIERLGNVAKLYVHAEDREQVLRLARQQGFVWRHEVPFRRKDGSAYDTLLSLTPVTVGGRPCWHAMVEDVTERKRAEERQRGLEGQLRQAQKMEAVGRMTAGIAHDFNNVLSIILTNVELIASQLAPAPSPVLGDLAELRTAAERGGAMIRKLLAFSRRADLEVEPTDLGALLGGLSGMLRHVVPAHIALDVSAAEGSTALVDPGAMEQIVVNLASNARDAIGGAGAVRIDARPVSGGGGAAGFPAWLPAADYVRLTVSDTGSGMDDATRTRALEPFFTTKPVGVGTGLGLPMVFGLVKQQRGFLDLASAPGKGTTVTLYLPRVATLAGAARPRLAPALVPVGDGALILLLEDDEPLRRTARRVLQRLGYRVLAAPDGVAGLDLFRAHAAEIALVIADVVMPGLTGPEVLAAVRRVSTGVPFLLSSGYSEREIATLDASATGVPVFRKPWTIEQLARRVRAMLDGAGGGGTPPAG